VQRRTMPCIAVVDALQLLDKSIYPGMQDLP
jgi:hypothetical protein